MWDLALFGRQDKKNTDEGLRNTELPLRQDQLEWWMKRMTAVIRKVKATWPEATIVFRNLHRVETSKGTCTVAMPARLVNSDCLLTLPSLISGLGLQIAWLDLYQLFHRRASDPDTKHASSSCPK